jgi:pullulanase/glycogen debranching enzyme
VTWLHPAGHQLGEHDWNDVSLRCIGVMMAVAPGDPGGELLLVLNNSDESIAFKLPELGADAGWQRRVDTVGVEAATEPDLLRCSEKVEVGPRSLLLLESTSAATS